jgi:hypothetical protein
MSLTMATSLVGCIVVKDNSHCGHSPRDKLILVAADCHHCPFGDDDAWQDNEDGPVVMCCVEVLLDDVTPSHDVAYTTEQCHNSPKSGFPQRPQGPAWYDKLPTEMFMNPFYGMSKDNEHTILQALQDEEDREWDAGWQEVPDRYRERRRKHIQRVKPK